MSKQPHQNLWNQNAEDLIEKIQESDCDIHFVSKKVRGGFTYSSILEMLRQQKNILLVEPTFKLIKDELDDIIETAQEKYNIDIKREKIIKWPGKRKECLYIDDDVDNQKYPFGVKKCGECSHQNKSECKVWSARNEVESGDWQIVGLTIPKLVALYQRSQYLKRSDNEDKTDHYEVIKDNINFSLIDECRYLANPPSGLNTSKFETLNDFFNMELFSKVVHEYNSDGLGEFIEFLLKIINLNKLSKEEPKYKRGYYKDVPEIDPYDLYYSIIKVQKKLGYGYQEILSYIDVFSSSKLAYEKVKNGLRLRAPADLKWKLRGKCVKDLSTSSHVILSDATNPKDLIKKTLGLCNVDEFDWGDPLNISKSQLVIVDNRQSYDYILDKDEELDEDKRIRKGEFFDLLQGLQNLTDSESMFVGLRKEDKSRMEFWPTRGDVKFTYYRSPFTTGISWEGRIQLLIGLPHTPWDSFLLTAVELFEGQTKFDFETLNEIRNKGKIRGRDVKLNSDIDEEELKESTKQSQLLMKQRKLRQDEMARQFHQTIGRSLDPTGDEKSVVVCVNSSLNQLLKLVEHISDEMQPLVTSPILDGHFEEDALIIAKGWRRGIYEKIGINDSTSLAVFARLYNSDEEYPCRIFQNWNGWVEWKENHPNWKKRYKVFEKKMRER